MGLLSAFVLLGVVGVVLGEAKWEVETVDSGPYVGLDSVSLAIDSVNRPHIAYYGGSSLLKYAHFDGNSWHIETVDATGASGWFCSLALDRWNRPHIAYRDINMGNLKYAWYDGNKWHIETVDASGLVISFPSLDIDKAGYPHIAYVAHTSYEVRGEIVKYAWYDGTNWYIETVIAPSGTAYVSLDLDSAGLPCMAIGNSGVLQYACRRGTDWYIETVDASGYLGQWNSLALDSNDHPHISYFDWDNGHLKYAWHDGTQWYTETVDFDSNVGGFTSIALNGDGCPYISYVAWGKGVKFAFYDGLSWTIEEVDWNDFSYATSIAVDSIGSPHIAYHFGPWDSSAVRHASRLENGCSQLLNELPSAGWHMITLPGKLCGTCAAGGFGDLVCALGDDLSPCYIFRYDPTVSGYVMAPPAENIQYHAGTGFWVRTYEDNVAIDADIQVTTEAVEVPLGKGWNQVGNPFTSAIAASALKVRCGDTELSLMDAQVQGWVSAYLFTYDPASGGYQLVSLDGCIPPWTGFWFRSYRSDCTLVINPAECPPTPPVSAMSIEELRARGVAVPPPSPALPELAEQIRVVAVPNPVRDVNTTTFRVLGICPCE
ncbi:MAG: hypothetical protein DRI26_02670, partial [Chloroflexi bacterium]